MREIVSPLSGIRSPFGQLTSPLAIYAVLGIKPQLVFDFEAEKYFANSARSTFSDSITHSRASTATYVDADGILQTAASGVPRVGHHVYNGSAWVNEGLLHESEARTNSLIYSEDFTNAAWFALNTATLAVDATGPDGETSAVTLADSGATGSGAVSLTETVTVATSTAYTFSLFAKADQLSWVSLQARNFTTPSDGQVFFNLSDGTVGATDAGYTASVQDFGNGWYRCSMTFTTDASDTSGALDIRAATGDNNAACDLDGTSSILVYGAQFEAGPTPSSYIPTSGATATRAAETLTIPAANLPWSSSAVSIQMDGLETFADEGSATQETLFDWQVDSNNRITLALDTDSAKAGTLTLTMVNGSGTDETISTTAELTPGVNDPFNVAIVCTSNEIGIALDGTAETRVSHSIGLPDLSGADATLGGNGTRDLLRAWNQDITNAGQEEASS